MQRTLPDPHPSCPILRSSMAHFHTDSPTPPAPAKRSKYVICTASDTHECRSGKNRHLRASEVSWRKSDGTDITTAAPWRGAEMGDRGLPRAGWPALEFCPARDWQTPCATGQAVRACTPRPCHAQRSEVTSLDAQRSNPRGSVRTD